MIKQYFHLLTLKAGAFVKTTLLRTQRRILSIVILLTLTAGLTSCRIGYNRDSNSIPPEGTPVVSLSVTSPKQIVFTWTPVTNAHHYRILCSEDGISDFTVVPEAVYIPETTFTLEVPVHTTDWDHCQYVVEACDSLENYTNPSEIQYLTESMGNQATGYFKASNTQGGDYFGDNVAISGDGTTLAVAAPGESSTATGLNGDQSLWQADHSGAVYIFKRSEEDGSWEQKAYVKASNTKAYDNFGASIALNHDGTVLAVGADEQDGDATGINGNDSVNAATDSGAVYVFHLSGEVSTWAQRAYIKASNTSGYNFFGCSLSLSSDGNTLVVGARGESSLSTGINGDQGNLTTSDSGAVYVFTIAGDVSLWAQKAFIKASNTGPAEYFGFSTALSNDGYTLAVGAYGEDSNATGVNGNQYDDTLDYSGAVYIFTLEGAVSSWAQKAYIKASNPDMYDSFGHCLALSGDGKTLAVGAYGEDSNATGINGDQSNLPLNRAGAVYIFSLEGEVSTWSQQAYIKASSTDEDDYFGDTVALSDDGTILAVGAPHEASASRGINSDDTNNSAALAGAAYVFKLEGEVSTWEQTSYIKAPNADANDFFGMSVALTGDGKTLAVGAQREFSNATGINQDQTDNSAGGAGAVYLY